MPALLLPLALPQSASTGPSVTIRKLASTTAYPEMARRARVAGTVQLNVIVRSDGTVESVTVVSGHPMLNPFAVESARQTEYDCNGCKQLTPYLMTYNFELGEALYCKGIDANGYAIYDQSSYQRVSHSSNTVTIYDRPFATCDPTVTTSFTKIRSAKCLWLWRCGRRTVGDNSP